MRSLARAAGILALLAVPVASACSLAGNAPFAGEFRVLDPGSGARWEIRVEDGSFGPDCTLGNAFALLGSTFAWHDGGGVVKRARVGERGSSTVGDFGDRAALALVDEETLVVLSTVGYVTSVGMHAERNHTLSRVDLATGATERVDFPFARFVEEPRVNGEPARSTMRIEGDRIFAMEDLDGDPLASVYDLGRSSWIVDRQPLARWGFANATWLLAAGGDWLILANATGQSAVNFATEEVVPFEFGQYYGRGPSVERGFAFGLELVRTEAGSVYDIERISLANGTREPYASGIAYFIAVADGRVVSGTSAGGVREAAEALWSVVRSIPAPGFGAALIGTAILAFSGRRP